MPRFDAARLAEIRAILADIESADQSRLAELSVIHVGYDYFADDENATVDSVRDDLEDFVREIGYAEGFHWSDIRDIEIR